MRRGDPERIRHAQPAGFIARLGSARSIGRERAAEVVARWRLSWDAKVCRRTRLTGIASWSAGQRR